MLCAVAGEVFTWSFVSMMTSIVLGTLHSDVSHLELRFLARSILAILSMIVAHRASAELVLGSNDARSEWPATAMYRTSDLPTAMDANITTRGVRAARIQSQNFQVVQAFSVQSIYLGYQLNSDDMGLLPTTFRIVETDNLGQVYVPATAPVVAAPLTTSLGSPAVPHASGIYAMRLDWDGPQPLILKPIIGTQQFGIAGYLFELVGGGTTSPITLIARNDGAQPNGRAIELSATTGASQFFNSTHDLVFAVTGSYVGPPGDFNNDGVVDGADYVFWRKSYGLSQIAGSYDLWRSNYGAAVGDGASLAGSIAIPEPANLALGVLLGLGLFALRMPSTRLALAVA